VKNKKFAIPDRNLFAHGQDTVLGSCRVTENQICWKQLMGLGGGVTGTENNSVTWIWHG
jgi:hypothetical protein